MFLESPQKIGHSAEIGNVLLSVSDYEEVGVRQFVLVDRCPVHLVLKSLDALSRIHGTQKG